MSLKKFIKNTIRRGSPDEQINLLKVYPVFRLDCPIIKFWINVYKKNNELLTKEKNINNLTHDENNNTIFFLKNGLHLGYINMDKKHLRKVMNLFHGTISQLEITHIIFNHCELPKKNIPQINMNFLASNFINNYEKNYLSLRSNILLVTFDDITEDEFVQAVNKYYLKIYNKISSHEICHKATKPKYQSENLTTLFNFFNIFSGMIPTEVLIKTNKQKKRIHIIKKFITIAEKFLETNNYEALYGIIAGLNNRVIQRIKDLWQPDKKHTIRFNELVNIITHEHNYNFYRNLIKDKPKYIPYLGLIFADIDHCLQINIVDPDNKKFNMETYKILVKIINSFKGIIPTVENFSFSNEDKSVIKFISNYYVADEDFLYQKSYALQEVFKPPPLENNPYQSNPETIETKDDTDGRLSKRSYSKISGRFSNLVRRAQSSNVLVFDKINVAQTEV